MRLQSRNQRRPARLLVHYWIPGRAVQYGEGHVVNLSSSGVYIATREPLPPPSPVVLSFVVGEDAIEVRGEVVRSLGGGANQRSTTAGMGVRFADPEQEAVVKLLNHRAESGAEVDEHESESGDAGA